MPEKTGFSFSRFAVQPLFLLLILTALAAWFRFEHLDWDHRLFFNPDEANIAMVAAEPAMQSSTGYATDFFAYGQLPLYLYHASAELLCTPSFLTRDWGRGPQAAHAAYWGFLVLLFAGMAWFFTSERMKKPAFVLAAAFSGVILCFKFFPLFLFWFGALQGLPLKGTALLFTAALLLAAAAWASAAFKAARPFPYLPCAWVAVLLFGVLCLVLPDGFSGWIGAMAFTLVVATALFALAWVSRWGRLNLAILAAWAFLAFLSHDGAQYASAGHLMVVGRWWSAFFSTLTIPAAYLFTARAYGDKSAALTASAFLAFAVLPIQMAHYCVTESFLALLMVGMALAALKVALEGGWRPYLLAGGVLGLALAAKTTCLLILPPLLFGHLWNLSRTPPRDWRSLIGQWTKLAGACGLALIVLCLLSPWSLLNLQGFLDSMRYEGHVVYHADTFYTVQFQNTLRFLYPLGTVVAHGLGWPLGVAAFAGGLWVTLRFFAGSAGPVGPQGRLGTAGDLILLSSFWPYFVFVGAWKVQFVRYFLPLYPLLCVFAALLLADLFSFLKARARVFRLLKAALLILVLGGSLFYALAYRSVYTRPHPWAEASQWIYENVAPGSVLIRESRDFPLPAKMIGMDATGKPWAMTSDLFRVKEMEDGFAPGLLSDDTPERKKAYADILKSGDYLIIASKRRWYTFTALTPEFNPKGFNRYPVESRVYRLLWSGLLGYRMVAEFKNFPSLGGWQFPDDDAEETFSVYDHPRAYVFKKTKDVPRARILKMLDTDDYVRGLNRDQMRQVTPLNFDAFAAERRDELSRLGLPAD